LAATAFLLGTAAVVDIGRSDGPQTTRSPAKVDRWESWRPLVGNWEGRSEGRPGIGTVKFSVVFVLDERYLRTTTSADYKTDKGGEHHEDFGFVSFDRMRSKFVYRQFHAEGFVNQYTLTTNPKTDGKIELTSESCENAPLGWKARETYKLTGDTLEHTFELAAPGKPFERYTAATLKRQKQ
jgi:hypothetical protein